MRDFAGMLAALGLVRLFWSGVMKSGRVLPALEHQEHRGAPGR